jgi:hypothetical protein
MRMGMVCRFGLCDALASSQGCHFYAKWVMRLVSKIGARAEQAMILRGVYGALITTYRVRWP